MTPCRRTVFPAGGLLAASLVAVAATVAGGQAADPTALRVVATHVLPAEMLAGDVPLGGISDLASAPQPVDAAGDILVWAITDRGPNGSVGTGDAKRRTLLAPGFAPAVLRLRLAASGPATLEATLPLAGASGRPLSGRPNGVGRDEPILDAASGVELPPDPDGIDPEGLVALPDGGFWACEEYRPSLLRLAASGRLLERHVPQGIALAAADTRIVADLPPAYGDRRDNRGFEGICLSSDGRRLFVLLQSPLDHPTKKAAAETGNVRLLVADAATGEPVAEHVYRLGDPSRPRWAERGAAPDDGKLCCLAALGDGTLAVLEQDDTGLVRLYRADPRPATDTLPRTRRGDAPAVETIGDLAAAGIVPLEKTLLADLAPLVPRFRADVHGGDGAGGGASLKLEGLTVLGERRILLANDNDFAVPGSTGGGTAARSCVWVVELPSALPPHEALTADR